MYGSNGILGFHDSFLIEGPAVVVGRKGSAGTVGAFSPRACWPIDTTYYVRRSDHVDLRFAFHLISNLRLDQFDRSTAVPGLNRNDVYELEVSLPPLLEQRRVVAKIDELNSEIDAGIESLQKARSQLATYRQAVLKHAFEGKLTTQWREANQDRLESCEQLLARIKHTKKARYEHRLREWRAAVDSWNDGGRSGRKPSKPSRTRLPDRIVHDELIDLPRRPPTWRYVRLSDLADVGSGMSVSRSRRLVDPIEVPYLSVANVQRGKLHLYAVRTMHIERSQLAAFKLRPYDVLFNEDGDRDKLGRGWIWGISDSSVHHPEPCFSGESISCFARAREVDFSLGEQFRTEILRDTRKTDYKPCLD